MDLGAEILGKKRVYLDQMWWCYLRDVEGGNRKVDPTTWGHHQRISAALKHMVESGSAICPVSYPIWLESFKQHGSKLEGTAKIIDLLSQQAALQPWLQRAAIEAYWLLGLLGPQMEVRHPDPPVAQRVWTYMGAILGSPLAVVQPRGRTPEEVAKVEEALNNVAFDGLAETSFLDIVGALSGRQGRQYPDDFEALNGGARKHAHEFSNFHEVLLHEVKGALEGLEPALAEVQRQMRWGLDPRPESIQSLLLAFPVEVIRFTIYTGYHSLGWSTAFPSVHIHAGIHAALRYRQQPIKKNDCLDFQHATAALPYYDVFLTEKKLGNLVTGRLLKLDEVYGTCVLWKAKQVADALEEMADDC